MMKIQKKISASLFAVLLLLILSTQSVDASESVGLSGKQPYQYTVTFYSGNQGSFSGVSGLSVNNKAAVVTQTEDQITVSGLNAGDEVGLTAQSAVTLGESSKYYVKGIRLSGRDNSTVAASAFIVEGDADYVVAYGIEGDTVSYTVSYVDEQGKELSASETFYGNIGDKPVIAYKYIEGYSPKALGLTKTLKENAADNVFSFVYEPVPVPTIEEIVTEEVTEVIHTEYVSNVQNPGRIDGDTQENGDAQANGDTQADSDTQGTLGEETEESHGADNKPQDDKVIVDLDDEEVPLSDFGTKQEPIDRFDGSLMIYIVMAVTALAALIAAAVLIKKRNKKA